MISLYIGCCAYSKVIAIYNQHSSFLLIHSSHSSVVRCSPSLSTHCPPLVRPLALSLAVVYSVESHYDYIFQSIHPLAYCSSIMILYCFSLHALSLLLLSVCYLFLSISVSGRWLCAPLFHPTYFITDCAHSIVDNDQSCNYYTTHSYVRNPHAYHSFSIAHCFRRDMACFSGRNEFVVHNSQWKYLLHIARSTLFQYHSDPLHCSRMERRQ